MKNEYLNKILESLGKLNFSSSINGNYNDEDELIGSQSDFKSVNKEKRNKVSFVNSNDINLSGIESNDFKSRLFASEAEENENRVYVVNNYKGFGYKKTLEDFEKTMYHILNASIVIKKEENDKKEEIIKNIQENLMKSFRDKTLSNDEVIMRVKKELELAEDTFGIKLTEQISSNAAILINKFRMSVFNLREGNRESSYKLELEKLQEKNLRILNNNLETLNRDLPATDKVSLKDILNNLKGRENLDINFKDTLLDKLPEDSKYLLKDIEIVASNVDKYSKELSEINKYERLSSLALNYFLAEKNLIINEGKKNNNLKLEDVVYSFELKKDEDKKIRANKYLGTLQRISKKASNERTMSNYIDRVHERINDNDKLNFSITKEEIEKSILDCKKMFEEYFSNAQDENSLYTKLSKVVSQRVDVASTNSYVEADILETISNTLKDNLYNKILENKHKEGKLSQDALNEYKINIEENLENGKYEFNKKKNEDLLSCDNMQKIFKMLSQKTLSNTEALSLLHNNRDILKSFSLEERYAVSELIENIAEIKKEEIKKQKQNSPFKSYLFEDLKSKDDNYNPSVEIADFLKRKQIDSVLNTGKNNEKSFTKALTNFFSNKYALMELYYCASKQVETRKMDTQLSMASQCMDTYKSKAEQETKEIEKNISTIASNPALTLSGLPIFIVFLMLLQKSKLKAENLQMIKNEMDIAKVINHVESINEQKIKDALTILYKLKHQEGKQSLTISNVTDKESLIDIKKDIFYAELLIVGKQKINLNKENIALDELSFKHSDALEHFKAIFKQSENKELFNEIEEELLKNKVDILESKKISYILNEEKKYQNFQDEQEKEFKLIKIEQEKVLAIYKNAYKKVLPELKDEIENSKYIFDRNNLNEITDVKTQAELRSMLKNISTMQDKLKEIKSDLTTTKSKLLVLKKERELITPYVDILNENGKIDTEKLSKEIKNNPHKIITMFNNLDAFKKLDKVENKNIRKMLMFNIVDRAANKNESNLSTSDFFNEIISKVIPHSKDIMEELTDFAISSSMHPNDDKIIFEISNRKNDINDVFSEMQNEEKNIFSNIFEKKDTNSNNFTSNFS